jgi:Na+-transporting NADH:ubiquinone oxidoreductase subunit NqrF
MKSIVGVFAADIVFSASVVNIDVDYFVIFVICFSVIDVVAIVTAVVVESSSVAYDDVETSVDEDDDLSSVVDAGPTV